MTKLTDFLQGTKIVEEVNSPVNGKITVIKSLAWGTYLQVGGLTQSGGVVYEVWQTTLRKLKTQNLKLKKCLILGLGGGSSAKLVRKYWPNSKITGVDIDPIIVELGKKYLGLDKIAVEVGVRDAYTFVRDQSKSKFKKVDLILIDLYVGDEFPKKFEEVKFLKLVGQLLANGGIAIFNRLYYGEKRKETENFSLKLEENFKSVERVFPEANLMFVCRNLSQR